MGGKSGGGGGGAQYLQAKTYVDPVTGRTFTDQGIPTQYGGFIPIGEGKSGSQQLNEFITQREAGEKAASDKAAADKAAADAQAQTTFNTSRDTAYNDAMSNVIRQFQLAGLNPDTYMSSDIVPRLTATKNAIRNLDPNPAAGFSPDLGKTIINDLTGGVRNKALTDLNAIFTPTYSTSNLPSSSLDPYINPILDEQFNPLTEQLKNAQKRNVLSDIGYNAALQALNQKRTGAQATVRSLGENILAGDRSALDDYISSARSAANSATVNSGFDPSAYTGQAKSMVTTDLSNLGGDIRNAVGETKFADLGSLINAGGAVQGGVNTKPLNASGGIPITSPTQADLDEMAKRERGLGNVGAF